MSSRKNFAQGRFYPDSPKEIEEIFKGALDKEEIDYTKLTDMAITRRIQPIFEGMGWPLSRVIEGRIQKSLAEYL